MNRVPVLKNSWIYAKKSLQPSINNSIKRFRTPSSCDICLYTPDKKPCLDLNNISIERGNQCHGKFIRSFLYAHYWPREPSVAGLWTPLDSPYLEILTDKYAFAGDRLVAFEFIPRTKEKKLIGVSVANKTFPWMVDELEDWAHYTYSKPERHRMYFLAHCIKSPNLFQKYNVDYLYDVMTSPPINMVKARKWVVKKHFDGVPKRSDFEIEEYELPPLKDGEILLKTEWISVDPYMRLYNSSLKVPYDQFGGIVGVVQETRDPNYPVGTRVVSYKGWCDYTIVKDVKFSGDDVPIDSIYKLPDLQGLSPSFGVGAVGMPGLTAYFAFLDICKPKVGETVVVTGAAGAVGLQVGQIAQIKGCRVIGFAGTDEKCRWLERVLGFDIAINYKTADIRTSLKAAAPQGVDCYFDNVGGELSSIIMSQMNLNGRVTVCGYISAYNEESQELPKATILQQYILFNKLKIEGFIIWSLYNRWHEGFPELIDWIKSGQLKPKEHITEGFDNVFNAFVGLFTGENTGKAVVKV